MLVYKKGNIVKGEVTGIEKYGIFVNLDNKYSGLIHISEISKGYVKNLNDYAKVGETIYVKIADINEEDKKVKLSIKDIDYKVFDSATLNIKETKSGFKTLRENLKKWIKEKSKNVDK